MQQDETNKPCHRFTTREDAQAHMDAHHAGKAKIIDCHCGVGFRLYFHLREPKVSQPTVKIVVETNQFSKSHRRAHHFESFELAQKHNIRYNGGGPHEIIDCSCGRGFLLNSLPKKEKVIKTEKVNITSNAVRSCFSKKRMPLEIAMKVAKERGNLRVYHCSLCDGFHLTHRQKRDNYE